MTGESRGGHIPSPITVALICGGLFVAGAIRKMVAAIKSE